MEAQAAEVARRLASLSERPASEEALTPQILDDATVGLARMFDPEQGGFGGAPKFPPSLALEFLVRRLWRRPDDPHAREMVELTLGRMAAGGIYDQVGGGFHRYSVDGRWLVPHFEKMLYDNALLARAYALAFRVTGSAAHSGVAQETLDYLLREMRLPRGGFGSAQDADSPGGEGAFFVWTPQELAGAADAAAGGRGDAPLRGHGGGELRGALDPPRRRAARPGVASTSARTPGRCWCRRARCCTGRGWSARRRRATTSWWPPGTAWRSRRSRTPGVILGRGDYVDAAIATAATVLDALVVDGRLRRVPPGDNGSVHLGQLDDHADLVHGLLRLYEATFQPRWLRPRGTSRTAWSRCSPTPTATASSSPPATASALVARTREVEDHPTPAGNSQAAHVLMRLADLTGDAELEARAGRALMLVRTDMARFPQAFGTALVALDNLLADRHEIAIVGPPDDPATAALIRAAREAAGPYDVIAAGDPDDPAAVAAAPLLEGRPLVDGAPAAYVCRRFACQAPVTDPDALRALLREDAPA